MVRTHWDFPARLLVSGLLAMVMVACQMPTSGSGLSLTPVVTLGQDAAGVARLSIRVPEGTGDRHVQSLPASWNEAVVYFDSQTARVQPYAFTIPRASFTQVTGGVIASLSTGVTNPRGIRTDRSGNLYVADSASNRVRKIVLATGVTTVVAGTGSAGSSGDSGPATSAKLNFPSGVAVDTAGNLFIADFNNHKIRRVDAATGNISTVAGTGSSGSSGDNGPATSAKLNGPEDVAVDAAGNLFIVDAGNTKIRRVDGATGVITTYAGSGGSGYAGDGGPATSATFIYPVGVAADGSGNLYIADVVTHTVRKVNAATKVITTVAGNGTPGFSGDGGPATSAQLNESPAVAVDEAGNLFITDNMNNRVRRVDAGTGVITTLAGTGALGFAGDGGAATSGVLNDPEGIAVDDLGNVYVSDEGNARIRKVTGAYAEFVAGTGSSPAMPVLRPATDYAISVDLRTSGSPATLEAVGFLGAQTLQAGPNTFNLSILDNMNVTSITGDSVVRDGTGAAAFFENPTGVAVDAAGTYAYVADRDNHCIRRLEIATGIVTTVAGNGQIGKTNGTAANARFYFPSGLALVGTNLYVADRDNHGVRKIDLALAPTNAGFVTTVAGLNGWDFADGKAVNAMFAQPEGIAAEPDGSALYVADTGNYRIRKINLTLPANNAGFVTTLAGNGSAGSTNGTGTGAKLDGATGLALDGAGNLYVADFYNQCVRKIVVSTKVVTTLAPLSSYPYGIAFDGTDLWVTEQLGGGRIRKVTLAGVVSTLAGGTSGFADGTGAGAKLSNPSGVACLPGGDLIVTDRDNHAIRRMVGATGAVSTVAGSPAAGWVDGPLASARFRSINGVCVDRAGSAVYVTDTGNHRIRKIDLVTGVVSTVAGNGFAGFANGTGAAAQFFTPIDVAVDDAGTSLFVTDHDNRRIRKIDLASGAVTTLAGSSHGYVDGTGAAARFTGPEGLTIDAAGNLYVVERFSFTIRKVTPAGVVTTIAGSLNNRGLVNGIGTAAKFFSPRDVALDRMGYLYVADGYNSVIRRITLATNEVTTLAGTGTSGFLNGPGASATFTEPTGIACDGGGNVYVTDLYFNGVRKIARDGYVTTVAGGTVGYQDGFRTAARFNGPLSLTVDAQGGIYVADTDNQTVRRIK